MDSTLDQTIVDRADGISIDPGRTVRGLRPAQLLFQRYTVKRLLGRGGMGIVWLAHDEKLDREVALKFVPEILFLDPAARDDLKRETRKSLELTHPNIVRIYDFIEDDEVAAISMEYVDGCTLSRLRVENSRRLFEPNEIEGWVKRLCDALDYAHVTARVVHRDLKPSNVMLNGRGEVKIADFGISYSLLSSVTRVSLWSSGGTAAYMSPQQMQGEIPSPLDDIYSLGATLYELIAGKPPFCSGNLALQIREVIPPPMAVRRASLGLNAGPIPHHWENVIAACLAKDPKDRPQSAGEVMDRLCNRNTVCRASPLVDTLATGVTRLASATGVSVAKDNAANQPFLRIPLRTAAIAGLIGALLLFAFFVWPQRPPAYVAARPATRPAGTPAPVAAIPALPAPLAPGGLIVKTSPPGATVELGGVAAETAPASFGKITPGSYPLKITLPEYEPVTMQTVIKPNEFTDLGTISLARSTGSLQVSSLPQGSDFQLTMDPAAGAAAQASTVFTGRTPGLVSKLPTGKYTLVLKLPGWPDEVKSIQVTRNSTTAVEWGFARGTLNVASSPAGAGVYLNGRFLGPTPLTADAAPGSYANLKILMDGYVPVTQAVTVTQGQETAVAPIQLQQLITELDLGTTPSGLQYVVTGSGGALRTGATPASIYDLPAGDYSVAFKRAGWPDFISPASLVPKQPVKIEHAFPAGTVVISSLPPGAQIFHGKTLLGTAPVTAALPPGDAELTARMTGMASHTHEVTVADGEEVSLEFNMRSGSSSAHHHRRLRKPPPTEMQKIANSIKTFFTPKSQTSGRSNRNQ